MTSFRDDAQRRPMPSVWRGHFGERLLGTMALLWDTLMEGTTEAWASMMLNTTRGPAPDAFEYLGSESLLERYPVESTTQYLSRLREVWDIWQHAGEEETLLDQLDKAGFPGAQIYTPLHWPTTSDSWSDFWVFWPVESNHMVTAPAPIVGAFVVGDGTIVGPVGITVEQLSTIRKIVRKFKPGHWARPELLWEISGWTVGTGHIIGEPGLVVGGSVARAGG